MELANNPEVQEWYRALVEDCKAIITEAVFISRWARVEGYHQLGERIATENNLNREEIYGKKILQGLAKSLNTSERTLYYAIQFFEKYPQLDEVPEGKNISWNKIVTQYLPEGSKELDAPAQEDKAAELQTSWEVEPGQVWILGNHRLVCGDSTDPYTLGIALDGSMPDVLINDPPYGMNLDTDYSKMPSTKPEGNKVYSPVHGDDIQFDYRSTILRCNEEFWFGADYYRKTIPDGGSWLVWDKRVEEKFDAMIGSAFELIWSKVKHKREIIRHNNTLFSGESEAKNKLHPTQKPTKVIEWIIERYSNRGNIIADLYAGTGTTILACENRGRICIAMEIDPKYVAVSLERWLKATNIQPRLEI